MSHLTGAPSEAAVNTSDITEDRSSVAAAEEEEDEEEGASSDDGDDGSSSDDSKLVKKPKTIAKRIAGSTPIAYRTKRIRTTTKN